MADEPNADDDLAALMQRVAPSGGVTYRPSNAAAKATEAQTNADADEALAKVMQRMTTPAPSGSQPPPADETFLNRSFRALKDISSQVVSDLTPTAPHWPGSTPAPERPPVQLHPLLAGAGRGVRDVVDTGAEGIAWGVNKLPRKLTGGVDLEGLRAANKAGRDQFEELHKDSAAADVGRVGGQILATAPAMRVAGLIGNAAGAVPGAIGAAANAISGLSPAATTLSRTAQLAAKGAGAGAADAALTSSASDMPVGQQVGLGATVGALGGPVIGGLTKAVDVLRGFAGGVRPEIARLADEARQLGVHIPVASMSDNRMLRTAADTLGKLPFSGAAAHELHNQRALQGIVAREMGSTANVFDSAMMERTARDLSGRYTAALAQVPAITGGAPLATDLARIGAQASSSIADRTGVAQVGRAIREVGDAFNNSSRSINGDQYRSLVESKGRLQQLIDGTELPAAKRYIEDIRTALEARLRASAPAGVADELNLLDRQWRAMHTVKPLAAKSNLGDIPLAQLKQQVINQANKYDGPTSGVAFTGGGPLGQVGRIGSQFFGHLPDSGTASRTKALTFAENPLKATVAAIPGLLNRPLQSWLRSPTVSGRVIDTSLGGAIPNISRTTPAGLLGLIDYVRDRDTPAQ